jgi:hypothetical protein
MKSVRTILSKHDTAAFRIFLDSLGLGDVIIGDYTHEMPELLNRQCICYAYSKKSAETVAILTHITLKYNSLYKAFCIYMIDIQTDPNLHWIP